MTASACPWCLSVNDDAAELPAGSSRPQIGDVSVCLYCGGLAVFTDDALGKRKPTDVELTTYAAMPEVQRAVAVTRMLSQT